MYHSHTLETFNYLNTLSTRETLFVFTWLILDDRNRLAVDNGKADRKLPYEINNIFTYSELNPLVCTAYRLNDLLKIYHLSGHEIINIEFGSWSGIGRNNQLTYQDVVISRRVGS